MVNGFQSSRANSASVHFPEGVRLKGVQQPNRKKGKINNSKNLPLGVEERLCDTDRLSAFLVSPVNILGPKNYSISVNYQFFVLRFRKIKIPSVFLCRIHDYCLRYGKIFPIQKKNYPHV